jgi:hypothetical protein
MLKEGGLVLWHDYRYRNMETIGVRGYLDELSKTLRWSFCTKPRSSLIAAVLTRSLRTRERELESIFH